MIQAVEKFRRWFLGELSTFVPSWFGAAFLGAPAARRLSFSSETESIETGPNGIVVTTAVLGSAPPALTLERPEIVDATFPTTCFLARSIAMPEAAVAALHKAAELDLLRVTPFKLSDVYWSLSPAKRQGGRVVTTQWIAKRSDIDALRERLGSARLFIRQVLVEGHPEAGVIHDFSNALPGSRRLWRALNGGLAASALALSVAIWLLPAWRAKDDLARLSDDLAMLRQEALNLRSEVEVLQAHEAERDAFVDTVVLRPRLVEALHEHSLELPDTVWLSELSFRQDGASFTGETSKSAAELVLSLSAMSSIKNPRLAGAVSRSIQGGERFEIAFDWSAPQ